MSHRGAAIPATLFPAVRHKFVMGSTSNQLVAIACGLAIVILLVIERTMETTRAESIVFYVISACLFGFAVWLWRHPSPPL